MSDNPYSPTTNPIGGFNKGQEFDISDVESVRRMHLSDEALIRGVGWLYLLGGALGVLAGLSGIVIGAEYAKNKYPPNNGPDLAVLGRELVYLGKFVLAVAIPLDYTGWTMTRLDPMGKIFAILFSTIGLICIPIGTLISAYMLYLLLSAKGKFIYSRHYNGIIAATPHTIYRSVLVWMVLASVMVAAALVVFFFLIQSIKLW